jgi:predicted ATP-grasp superfamily ATP-dependent carboligase
MENEMWEKKKKRRVLLWRVLYGDHDVKIDIHAYL